MILYFEEQNTVRKARKQNTCTYTYTVPGVALLLCEPGVEQSLSMFPSGMYIHARKALRPADATVLPVEGSSLRRIPPLQEEPKPCYTGRFRARQRVGKGLP